MGTKTLEEFKQMTLEDKIAYAKSQLAKQDESKTQRVMVDEETGRIVVTKEQTELYDWAVNG